MTGAAEVEPAQPTTAPDADSPPTDAPAAELPGPETAKFRRRAQAAEAERDTLRQRVEGMQRNEIERLAAVVAKVARPSSIWAAVDLADMLNEDGDVDEDRATTAILAAVDSLGLSVVSRMKPDLSQGPRDGGAVGSAWQNAFK